MILERPDWQDRSACKGVSHEIFFPENPGGQESVYNQALNFCANCEVTKECLAYALEFENGKRERFGVFGGMTPKQRWLHDKEPVQIVMREK